MSGPRGETRARARTAALRLFAERGYGATTLQDIADATNVTKAALYYYFRTRDDILADVAEPVLARHESLLADAEPAAPLGPAALRTFLTGLAELAYDQGLALGILMLDPTARAHPDLADRWEGLRQRMMTVVAGPDRDTATEARVVAAMVATIMPALALREDPDREAVVRTCVAAGCAVLGVRAPREPRAGG